MKKISLILLVLLILGCSSQESLDVESANKQGILLLDNGTEPQGLDPHIVTGVTEHKIIIALFEGLTMQNPKGEGIIPAAAESWTISSNGKELLFKIRDDAVWSNGDPLTADDFVYSWKRILTPALGSKYPDMLYAVKNAEDYNKGLINNFNQVGVEALDEKILKTPAKKEMLLPTKALAKKIALEWDKQVGEINPNAMPFTKSANAALDKVIEQFEEVSSLVSDYGDTDLLYYRADSPAELQMRQQSSWDPIINWAEKKFEVKINCGTGILYIPQDKELVYKLSQEISELSSFQLTSLYDIVSITGSLILGLATINGRLSAEDAFNLSRIDELWQIEQWGVDEEAQAVSDLKYDAIMHAQEFFILSSGNKSTIF